MKGNTQQSGVNNYYSRVIKEVPLKKETGEGGQNDLQQNLIIPLIHGPLI